jgi:hypothetical protein
MRALKNICRLASILRIGWHTWFYGILNVQHLQHRQHEKHADLGGSTCANHWKPSHVWLAPRCHAQQATRIHLCCAAKHSPPQLGRHPVGAFSSRACSLRPRKWTGESFRRRRTTCSDFLFSLCDTASVFSLHLSFFIRCIQHFETWTVNEVIKHWNATPCWHATECFAHAHRTAYMYLLCMCARYDMLVHFGPEEHDLNLHAGFGRSGPG